MTVTEQPARPGGFVARYLRTRRTRQETTVTTAEAPTVLMQFRTRGGAIIDLYPHTWTAHYYATANQPAQTHERTGFNWTCRGCDLNGKGNDGWEGGYGGSYPGEARKEANEHAGTCWSTPKPEAS